MIEDGLGKMGNPTAVLAETTFVKKAAALVNDADDGIAFLVMGNGTKQDEIRATIGNLAEEVARAMRLPTRPRTFRTGSN